MEIGTMRRILILPLVLLSVGVAPVFGQQQQPSTQQEAPEVSPESLSALLERVRQGRLRDNAENRRREQGFRVRREQRAELLRVIKAEKARLEAESERLEEIYEKNDAELVVQQQLLRERKGDLTELFGHMTSAAGDLVAHFEFSLASVQHRGRENFLNQLIDKINAQSDQLPSVQEIEKLWYYMQQEMTESGRVVRFEHQVTKPNGKKVQRKIVRVGAFNLVSDEGKYLHFDSAQRDLQELARQPHRRLGVLAKKRVKSEKDFVKMGIDPTGPSGGSFLAAFINSPTLEERWRQGGIIGYIITALGGFAFLLAIWRLTVLTMENRRVQRQLRETDRPRSDNSLGRVLAVYKAEAGLSHEVLAVKLDEAVLKERPHLEHSQTILRIIAAVAPLMGLLGTVTGMIITFQQITIFGAGDPKAMAGGISTALVTTVLGLCVAIPTVLLHTFVSGRSRNILHILEERSSGIIAEHSEMTTGQS